MKTQKKLNPSFLIVIVSLFTLLILTGCNPKKSQEKSFVVLAINDVYRTEGLSSGKVGGLARVKTIRDELISQGNEVLLLHAGDFLQPSFKSRINKGAAMIDVMNQLDNQFDAFDEDMIVTFGNHEFDKSKLKDMSLLQQRIDESEFYWLDSNINWLHHETLGSIQSGQIKKWLIKEKGGLKIGIYSLTTDMNHPDYIASFDDILEVSKHYVPFLKSKGADVVIALTHLQLTDDKKVLNLPQQYRPDLIVGGHEHYRQLEQIDNSWVVKADADALSAAIIQVTVDMNSNVNILPTFKDLDESVVQETHIQNRIQTWTNKTSVTYCQKLKLDSDCLEFGYGTTKVELVAEESEIRRFETNMGNFIADTAKAEFEYCNADIVAINSGSIRLNHNIDAGSVITRKHIEGMFPYPSDLKQIKINGSILKQMLTHTIDMWTANGHWLLVSGIKYTHNPDQQTFSQLRWADSNLLITDNEEFTIVVPQYLIDDNTDHDGYHMINETMIQECDKNGSNLKQLVINSISNTVGGINPKIDGRICNTLRNNCQ
ncbi:MAG: bifunctional UDP-sugar hydrolase/5'-nucleotidase [Marinicellaceae bacterium]